MGLVGFPGGSAVRNQHADVGDTVLIFGSENHLRGVKGQATPLFLSGKFLDRGACRNLQSGAPASWTQLNNWSIHTHRDLYLNLLFPNLGFCIISFFIHFINIEYLLGVWHWEYRDEKDSLYSQGAQSLGKKKKNTQE